VGSEFLDADLLRDEADGTRVGRYRLLEELGRGGQGQVFRAQDLELGREVALKILKGGVAISATARLRFKGEAEKAAKLDHPNIARVHEWGQDEGVSFIAMEFVRGPTLASWIRDQLRRRNSNGDPESYSDGETLVVGDSGATTGAGSAKLGAGASSSSTATLDRQLLFEVSQLIESAARGLHEAHERGLVHRDIKPGNLIVTSDRGLVILDFGLARDETAETPALTLTGDVVGTPAYLSPEQLSGGKIPVDRRSDIFSLGVTLFECLALRRPFTAPTLQALFQEIITREAPDLRRLSRKISADLAVIVAHALAKHPDQRYQTAHDLAEDLRRFRHREPILARPVGPLVRAWRWAQRKPATAALLAVLMIAIPTVAALTARHFAMLPQVRKQEIFERDQIVEEMLQSAISDRHARRFAEAEETLSKILALDSRSAEAAGLLAMSKLNRGDAEAALKVLDRHQALEKEAGALSAVRARVLEQLGRLEESAGVQASLSAPRDHLDWYLGGVMLLGTSKPGDSEPALRALDCLLTAAMTSPTPRASYYYLVAAAILDCGEGVDPATIERTIRVLTGIFGDRQESLIYAAELTSDATEAAKLYRQAIAFEDGSKLRYNLGIRLIDAHEYEDAVQEFRKSIELDPRSAEAHINLGFALRCLGRGDEALVALRQGRKLDSASLPSRVVLANELAQLGALDESIAVLERALEIDPQGADIWFTMGFVQSARRDAEAAQRAFRRAVDLGHPSSAEALANVGFFHEILGRPEEAERAYLESLSINARNARAQFSLAALLSKLERYDEALDAARKSVAITPQDPRSHFQLGQVLRALDRLEEATSAFRRCVELDESEPCRAALVASAIAWSRQLAEQGQRAKAIEALRGVASLAIDPDVVEREIEGLRASPHK
jgi:serine/threonine protein kinase/tetratricopeptide (TPR) repeat protein